MKDQRKNAQLWYEKYGKFLKLGPWDDLPAKTQTALMDMHAGAQKRNTALPQTMAGDDGGSDPPPPPDPPSGPPDPTP